MLATTLLRLLPPACVTIALTTCNAALQHLALQHCIAAQCSLCNHSTYRMPLPLLARLLT
jgi:hypothetical protein